MTPDGRPTSEGDFRQMYGVPDPYAECQEVNWYVNSYHCTSNGCDTEWTEIDASTCNDRCPACRAETAPYKSTDAEV